MRPKRLDILLGTGRSLGIVGLDESGQCLICLGLVPDVTADGEGGGLTGEEAGDGIDIAHVDLDAAVIVGGQKAVGPGALSGDV